MSIVCIDTNLLSPEIITVMHVLVLAQVCGDLSHFCVELYIIMLLVSKHDGVLQARNTGDMCVHVYTKKIFLSKVM